MAVFKKFTKLTIHTKRNIKPLKLLKHATFKNFKYRRNITNANLVGNRIDLFYNSFHNELLTFNKPYLDYLYKNQTRYMKTLPFDHNFFIKNYSLFLLKLIQHVFKFTNFLINTSVMYESNDLLTLNYKRRNFFPSVSSRNGKVLVTSSLGLFSKMLNKGKSFIRNKSIYLMSAMFLRKLLIYSSIKQLTIFIKRQPLYFNEILSTLFKPVINVYKHPFNNRLVDEKFLDTNFTFRNIIFLQNKNYTNYKTRKRGRLKRRIMKRLIKVNNVLD